MWGPGYGRNTVCAERMCRDARDREVCDCVRESKREVNTLPSALRVRGLQACRHARQWTVLFLESVGIDNKEPKHSSQCLLFTPHTALRVLKVTLAAVFPHSGTGFRPVFVAARCVCVWRGVWARVCAAMVWPDPERRGGEARPTRREKELNTTLVATQHDV